MRSPMFPAVPARPTLSQLTLPFVRPNGWKWHGHASDKLDLDKTFEDLVTSAGLRTIDPLAPVPPVLPHNATYTQRESAFKR